ncbi:MAG: type II secretion system protein GspD, partial [Bdellovibrionales bacterium]
MMTKAMTVIPVILSLSLPPHLVWGQASPPKANLTKAQQEKFARSGPEDITNENFPETIESFDFPNADVADIVKAVSELTGRNFILDPGVRGKVTIIAPSKITVAEAYKMFLSALAIHGYAIVPSDGYFKIKAARQAQRDSIETFSGSYYPNSDQMITKIIHLKYISADEVLKQFRNSTTKDGDINAYA